MEICAAIHSVILTVTRIQSLDAAYFELSCYRTIFMKVCHWCCSQVRPMQAIKIECNLNLIGSILLGCPLLRMKPAPHLQIHLLRSYQKSDTEQAH